MPKWISIRQLFLVLLIVAGCSGAKIDPNDPGALYKEAEEEIQGEHYIIALEKLRSIRNKFPYSKYSVDAQLRIADVYYLQELFPEAAGSYESFRDLHPNHEKASYASYRIAKAYLNDTPSNIARDQTSAQKAMEAYLGFMKRFPNAKEAAEARKDVEELKEQLATKELYVANYYFKRNHHDSAKPRYKKILELYPESKAALTAKEKLARIESRAPAEGLSDGQSDSQRH
jgi:outer membrane protein assembly factor BamD